MTREEAIERLKTDIYKYADFTENPNEDEFWMAFDMAIESLGQEPCEDAISIEEAIHCLEQFVTVMPQLKLYAQKVADAMRDLHPVYPKPKTGHWIADVDKWGDIVTTVNGYRCDKCNAFNSDKDNYCPNCGAKMTESEDNNE